MTLLQKIQTILLHPTDFFASIEKERGIGKTASYVFAIFLFGVIASSIVAILTMNTATPEQMAKLSSFTARMGISSATGLVIGTVLAYLLFFVGTFLNAVSIHLAARLLGCKGTFAQTYQAIGYGTTPQFLFIWIPYARTFTAIWMLVLQFIGLRKLHGIGNAKVMGMMIIGDFFLLLIIAIPLIAIGILVASLNTH